MLLVFHHYLILYMMLGLLWRFGNICFDANARRQFLFPYCVGLVSKFTKNSCFMIFSQNENNLLMGPHSFSLFFILSNKDSDSQSSESIVQTATHAHAQTHTRICMYIYV